MSPTLLELAVALLLLWAAWEIGLILAPRIIFYFRRVFRRPPLTPPSVTARAEAAFRAANQKDPPYGDDR
jgi:hypothetical protein